jgi:ribonuclease Z
MSLEVIFLGTAGSVPTSTRGLPAIAIQRKDELILFDCGEGVQRQMIRAKVGFHRKAKVFITHMHGDHVLGLPGLIQTMALLDRKQKLEIFGPVGIKAFIEGIRDTVQFVLTFPIEISEIRKEGLVCAEKEYQVNSVKTDHGIFSLAYALEEKPRPGRFNLEKAKELGIPEGPLWSKLQHGEEIRLPNGHIVKPEQVVGEARSGRKIVYSGDTRPTEHLVKLAANADLLIHEATFDEELMDRAKEDGHSTPTQAAKIAKKTEAKWLILTHVSARYQNTQILLKKAKEVFPKVEVAEDFMKIEMPLSES